MSAADGITLLWGRLGGEGNDSFFSLFFGDVQKAGDHAGEAAVFVVDVGIEQAGFACGVLRDDIVVGDKGGNEGGVALTQVDGVARLTDADVAVTLYAHGDDERVVLDEVAMEGTCGVDNTYLEVGGVDTGVGSVGGFVVECAVFIFYMEVDGFKGKIGVQLSWFAVKPRAVVVEDAIGDIAALLHLCQEDAAADGMDASCGEIEHVAWFHFVAGKHLCDATVGYALLIFVGRDVLLQPCIEIGSWLGVDDVPAFGFSVFVVAATCQFVTWVYLNAEVVSSIDEFDQEGKFASVLLTDCLSEDVCTVLVDDADKVTAGKGAVADGADAGGHGTDFPAFANGFIGGCQSFVGTQFVASPHHRVKVGLKKEGVKRSIHAVLWLS